MKVVLDTNVLVSGLIFGGTPARILSAWSKSAFTLILSPTILDEYRRVGWELAKGREPLMRALDALLATLAVNATLVNAPPLSPSVCEDPDDDKFLAAALAGAAARIVSGDKHLLRLSGWRGIEILTPRQFADRHLADADS
ncbi:MAG: putative toxin-antitoxin system toxin component, PIN family [Gemmatimonadaceae bacterium]